MPEDYLLGKRDFIPFIGQRNYNQRKRELYNRLYLQKITEENLATARNWELRHTALTIYNWFIVLGLTAGTLALLGKGLENIVK